MRLKFGPVVANSVYSYSPISYVRKYRYGNILELFIETNFSLKENYQGFQTNCASDLKTSPSCSNDVMITPHLKNIEKSNFHTHLNKKV